MHVNPALFSHPAQSQLARLEEDLLCPVSFELLTKAVTLSPCAHKVQESIAQELFGLDKILGLGAKKKCPLCRTIVLAYTEDFIVRNIATQYSFVKQEVDKLVSKVAQEQVHIKKRKTEKEKQVNKSYQYPGKSANFVYVNGNWETMHSTTSQLKFRSATFDSLIKAFELNGNKDGSVSVKIIFSKNVRTSSVKEYFNQYNINIERSKQLEYESKNYDQLQSIINILYENNEIPPPYFDKIKEIVGKTSFN